MVAVADRLNPGADKHYPSFYYAELYYMQYGLCAWPLCRKPLPRPDDNERLGHVDHNHLCCDENGRTCGRCVRGAVHATCNVHAIKHMDLVVAYGGKLPPIMDNYIRRGYYSASPLDESRYFDA